MKTINYLTICLMAIILFSCQKNSVTPGPETGSLRLDIGIFINENALNSPLKATPLLEELAVIIYRADGTEALSIDSVKNIPDMIELSTGDYYVEAFSNNNLPAEFENPYFFGTSDIFTILSNEQSSVQVNCEVANTMVSVTYSDNIINSFSEYFTRVSSSLGSLVFTSDEIRPGYFQPLPLEIIVELTYLKPDGTEGNLTLTGNIPDPQPNRHYEILVNASISEGMANFQIMLDDSEVPVEVVEISESPGIPQPGEIEAGELLITEIMSNPSALSDTDGEWFEIYNNSGRNINLQNLVLERDDLNQHVISDPIVLLPGAYYVLSRTELATDASNQYSYGSAILLPNTGAVISIYNEGTGGLPGALIFSLNYGEPDFPVATGASIVLDPSLLDPDQANLGTSWCISTSVFSTGDLGTPGLINDSCQ